MKGEVLELGEQRHCGTKGGVQSWECRDIRDKRQGTKGKVLELGKQRYYGKKAKFQSWEGRDIMDKRRSFSVGRAEILWTKDEVLELGEQRCQ